jgi:protein phosphatase
MNRVVHAGLSDRGRVRSSNEDRWYADPQQQLYLVADGMGDHLAGEVAAQMVVQALPPELQAALGDVDDLSDPSAAEQATRTVARFSQTLHDESQGQPGLDGMGAAIVLALVRGRTALLVHMGDCAAYLLHADVLQRVTKDHSLAQLLFDEGKISAAQATSHPAAGRLTRYVGMPGQSLPEAQVVNLGPGDRLLLCTDGLNGMLDDEQSSLILKREEDPEQTCRRLIDAANEAGGKDNVTALVIAIPRG